MKYTLTYTSYDFKNKHLAVDSWHDLTRETLISRVVECLDLFRIDNQVVEPKNKIIEPFLAERGLEKNEIRREIKRMKNAYDAWAKTVDMFSTGYALAGIIRVDEHSHLEIHAAE